MTSVSLNLSKRQASRLAANQRWSVLYGGKPAGMSRQGRPERIPWKIASALSRNGQPRGRPLATIR
jgi:hypothetical protein